MEDAVNPTQMQGTVVMQQNFGITNDLRWLLLALLGTVGLSGCTGFRLPRIDPSGQRFFLPAPAHTTLEPSLSWRGFSRSSGPAYRSPPEPVLCPPGVLANTPAIKTTPLPTTSTTPISFNPLAKAPTRFFQPKLPSRASHVSPTELVLTPDHIVALVGKPVWLHASLHGADHTRLPGQPIEWILSQDSVGRFVAVNEEGHFDRRLSFPKKSRQLTNCYALGRTASVTQPSANRNLQAGEAWLSLTSLQEGPSQVIASTKGTNAETTVRQTATIQWVDAQWAFPAAVASHPGKPVELSTTVLRASDNAPAAGKIIRYEIISGAAAHFGPTKRRIAEIPTDLQGVARVQIISQNLEAGETQIAVQVIQPMSTHWRNSRVLLGQGETLVRWDMPALALRVTGPDQFDVDSTMTIRVDVTNTGNSIANGVIVSDIIPTGVSFLNSDPPAQVFGDRVQWTLGALPTGRSQVIEFNCRADRTGKYQHHLQARASNGATAKEHLVARVMPTALELQISGPESARVGDQVQFRIIARNVGSQPLTNVIIRDVLDPGFLHAEAESPIVRELGNLEPGGEIPFAVTLTVTQPGTICHQLELKAAGGHATAKRICLDVVGNPQQDPGREASGHALLVTKAGPQSLQVGQEGEFVVQIENNGNVPLADIRVMDQFPTNLQAVQATDGFQRQRGLLIWPIDRLEPGQYTTRTVRYRCNSPGKSVCTQVTVTCTEPSLTVTDEVCLELYSAGDKDPQDKLVPLTLDISKHLLKDSLSSVDSKLREPSKIISAPLDLSQPPPSLPKLHQPDSPVLTDVTGLQLTVTDLNDPIRQGRRMLYLVHVVNQTNTSDQNVQLRLQFPANLNLENTNLPLHQLESVAGTSIYTTEPVTELRPGDDILLRLEVTAAQAGQSNLQVTLESSGTQTPILVVEETTILDE